MKIGFIQGRLSPLVDGKIQAFPWDHWENEFSLANQLELSLLEWTLDHERIYENPVMTNAGQEKIKDLCEQFKMNIPSLTGDFFMQAPFTKASGSKKQALLQETKDVLEACKKVDTKYLVIPLVDNGRIESEEDENQVVEEFLSFSEQLEDNGQMIVFESDYSPKKLRTFIEKFPSKLFGINYDIGNSAALNYDCSEEIVEYGHRIENVHIKDRVKGGTTVPLGEGNADLPKAFRELKPITYEKNWILQTARAQNDDHAGVLKKYIEMTKGWLGQ